MARVAADVLLRPLQKVAFKQPSGFEALAAAGRSICVVGKKDALCKAATQLSAALGAPHLAKQAEALSAGYAGARAEAPWLDKAGELRQVTLVALPEAAGRCVTPVRPDVIAKQLHGKVAGQEVVLAVGEEDALAAALAVARCVPPYAAKVGKTPEESTCNVSFFGCKPSDDVLRRIALGAESIRLAQGLVDMPPNTVNTTFFKDLALEAVRDVPGVTHSVIEGEELRDRGYGLLWAVGKSATCPPYLLVLTHAGAGDGQKGVALVGKGITFDTGGAALKPREGMCGMKRDMGGAAGMFGAFLALAKTGGLPSGRPLHCVLCLAENGIGPAMFLQDDILTAYSGLTVEINNTDAEGRLVLSDGAAHVAKHLDCDLVADMATLTGAQSISTGTHHGLILATDEDLETDVIAAGKYSGDMVHPGIFAPELLLHEFDSDFADMTNSVKNRGNAQSSCAGLFIYKHLTHCGYAGRWLHVDMASPAYKPLGEFGTGWGVGLFTTLLSELPRSDGTERPDKKRLRARY